MNYNRFAILKPYKGANFHISQASSLMVKAVTILYASKTTMHLSSVREYRTSIDKINVMIIIWDLNFTNHMMFNAAICDWIQTNHVKLRKLTDALDDGQVFSAPKVQSLQDDYSYDEYRQLTIDHQP